MPWAQFDDHSPDTVAWLKAGGEALGLHALATCWCAAHLSDGALPDEAASLYLARFAEPEEMVRRLEAAGLWERVEGGWRLPGFLRDNRSRERVEADRKRREERARKGGRAKAAKDRGRTDGSDDDVPY
ncbi:MAG: hypothetical protein M3401_17905 [Actinomycetota bacterium]|nr:hypothetical protein [Actinomycetota bacterium]